MSKKTTKSQITKSVEQQTNLLSVEDIYKKKSLHEHILLSPDTYMGSASCTTEEMWVFDIQENKMIFKKITFPPGLYKINDELYVNAKDHSVRDPTCKIIKVNINRDENTITVYNNGNGIPVEIHKDVNVYVPEMIFSQLLTSSAYEVKGKTVGGKNGYGAKLANIYSLEFIVETVDKKQKKKYIQKFSNNMYTINPPVITNVTAKVEPYTKIIFKPDLAKFDINELTDDIVSLLEKRVYDLAACRHNEMSVYLNDKLININCFEDYIKLYYDNLPSDLVYQEFNDRWKVGMLFDPKTGFRQVSFVNSICTYQGGTHVNHVLDQISKALISHIKNKNTNIKASYIKENITLFIDCVIEDPSFKSQTKEELTTKVSAFGSKCEITEEFIKKVIKTGIVEEVIRLAEYKHQGELSKTDFRKTNNMKSISKLDDAQWAGSTKWKQCYLILTEGDSAKSFAVAGLDVVGRERFGVFPLRGKFLNVREATVKQLLENQEFKYLKQILGLKQGRKYDDKSKLRYGGVIILTDQDSIAGDTPLLLRKDGKFYIQTIETISPDFYNNDNKFKIDTQKEYGSTDFEVWTEKGWTKIKHIMRHKVTKQMFRILTNTGIVDVTEDHSLLNNNGDEISPKDCEIDMELLHSFPKFDENMFRNQDYDVTEDEAYVMGLLFSDSTCGKENRIYYSCAISNTNLTYLQKAKNIMSKLYNYEFEIIEDRNCYKFPIIEKYLNLFYDKDNQKCVPMEILNSSRNVRQSFFNGYYDGEGTKDKKERTESFDINGKIGSLGLYFLTKSLGYEVSLNHQIKKPNIYTLTLTKGHQQDNPYQIKEIIKLDVKEQYVYDLETENHHFHAGVGEMIVHNTDGSHIKGLIINMLATFWPSLLKMDGYIKCMSTPIIKAFKKSDVKKQSPLRFYTIADYKNWVENDLGGDTSKYFVKYYKGLGTSTDKEAKEVFNDFENRLVKYVWETAENNDINDEQLAQSDVDDEQIEEETVDCENETEIVDNNDINSKSYQAIMLAFTKSMADDRKTWLIEYDKNNILDINNKEIPYSDFINKELIHFSAYSNQRSIPSVIDGFKPSHRKIYFGCTVEKIDHNEAKVAQLGAAIAKHTLYHHGEESLYKTIVKMAQIFVGSNNINLLLPLGEFGNRRQGGKNSASPRYIFTQLSKLSSLIFRKEDECIYDYIDEDGTPVEPEIYAPIIPFILVNGAEGIGTGFSTYVPPYNPKDIIKNLLLLLNDQEMENMIPWFRGFKGDIKVLKDNKIQTSGIYEIIDDKTIKITELPIEFWTDDYKDFLESVQIDNKSASKVKFVESYISNSGNNTIEFIITLSGNTLQNMIKSNTLEKSLKLTTNVSLNNMYLHNSKGTITKYSNVNDIFKEFYEYRLNTYIKRKQHILKIYQNELKIVEGRVRFIEYVLAKKIKIEKREENDIIQDLHKNDFEELSHNIASEKPSFRYLTDMKLFSLTNNKMKELMQERDKKKKEYDLYAKLTVKEIWKQELDEFMKEYNVWLEDLEDEVNVKGEGKMKNKGRGGKGKDATITVKGRKGRGKAVEQVNI